MVKKAIGGIWNNEKEIILLAMGDHDVYKN